MPRRLASRFLDVESWTLWKLERVTDLRGPGIGKASRSHSEQQELRAFRTSGFLASSDSHAREDETRGMDTRWCHDMGESYTSVYSHEDIITETFIAFCTVISPPLRVKSDNLVLSSIFSRAFFFQCWLGFQIGNLIPSSSCAGPHPPISLCSLY